MPSVRCLARQEFTHKRGKDSMTDVVAFKERQQQGYLTGDFGIIARTMVIVGELLCEAVDLRPGQHVLDVATGTGNTALAAARRGCDVIGLDWATPLLASGQERAAAERLAVTFCAGEAEQLPFPDASFDAVLSTFGAMYAPDHTQTARELLRVCRTGGTIGLTNFTPESFNAAFAAVARRSLPPPPPGLPSAFLWGTEGHCRALFGEAITVLQVTERAVIWRYRSPQEWLEVWRAALGNFREAFAQLNAASQAQLANDLKALVQRFNRSGDTTVLVPSAYLEVIATKR
jgi:ubiquinone/menaquinone biosynthesis C-methylase UbiE